MLSKPEANPARRKMDRSRESPHAQSELRASKRPRLDGDVHGSPKAQSGVGCEQEVDGDHLNRDETETCFSLNAKGTARNASLPWRDDDEDSHYVFALGENLTSRYKIHSKMGKVMHDINLIHTDLKPENILFVSPEILDHEVSPRSSSAIKLIDFGSTIISTTLPTQGIIELLSDAAGGKTLFETHENLEHLAMMEKFLGVFPDHMLRRAESVPKTCRILYRFTSLALHRDLTLDSIFVLTMQSTRTEVRQKRQAKLARRRDFQG
ncbi:Serine/threonine-protein kinase AFC1 [Acorus calamus]|uniref:Serine/threonine-protein kinase AFC1 n=1 Tax=Acorus calamus TaxID=4465 RepID=A0AAV9ES34_ACOCL|nr:Serine/threonine-protein kinase AFC1 [Acorus calamus]